MSIFAATVKFWCNFSLCIYLVEVRGETHVLIMLDVRGPGLGWVSTDWLVSRH